MALIHKHCGGELIIDPTYKVETNVSTENKKETVIGICCSVCKTRIAAVLQDEVSESPTTRRPS